MAQKQWIQGQMTEHFENKTNAQVSHYLQMLNDLQFLSQAPARKKCVSCIADSKLVVTSKSMSKKTANRKS